MKKYTISFRASSYELNLLEAIAEAYQTSKSELVRMMIRREAEDRALEVFFKSRKADQEYLFELAQLLEKDTVLANV